MYPLIEIKSVPIELQFKTTSASLEYTRGTAEMEISRSEQGGVNVTSRPIQVKLDTFEQRGGQFSAATAAVSAAVSQQQQQPAQAQYQATSAYADQGQIQLSARISQSIPQAAPAAQTAPDNVSKVATTRITTEATSSTYLKGFANAANGQSPFVLVNTSSSVLSTAVAPGELKV